MITHRVFHLTANFIEKVIQISDKNMGKFSQIEL